MKKYRYLPWTLGGVLLLSLLLSGWLLYGRGGGVNMTHQQAANRSDQLISDTIAVLTPKPRLELDQPLSLDSNCDNALGEMSSKVTTGKTYRLHAASVSDNAATGRQVLAYWQKQGYQITQSTGIGTDQPAVHAQTPDGFQLDLYPIAEGLLTLTANSPCVQPKPTTTS